MLRSSLFVAAKTLEGLGLCLWLGGLIATGAVVAPAAFDLLGRVEAGHIVGECFRRVNLIGYGCGVVLLLALGLESAAGAPGRGWLRAARTALVAATLGIALYLGLALFPAMDALRAAAPDTAGTMPVFRQLHHRAGQWISVQALLLVGTVLGAALTHRPGTVNLFQSADALNRSPFAGGR